MSSLRQGVLLTIWIFGIAVGLITLMHYDLTPGRITQIPNAMPDEVIELSRDGAPTLLFFAHPKCRCTIQSLEDLSELLQRNSRPLIARVLFVCPPGTEPSWIYGEAWDVATRIEGASLCIDVDGTMARACGVETSGQVLVFNAFRRLVFCGGLTNSRGSSLPYSKIAAVIDALDGHNCNTHFQPTYGCPLFDPPFAKGT